MKINGEKLMFSWCMTIVVLAVTGIMAGILVSFWFILPAWAALAIDVVFLGTWLVCYLRVD